MKAFVIEEDQVKQYVFGVVGAIVLAFVLGYLLGSGALLGAFDTDSSHESPPVEAAAPAETGETPQSETDEAQKAATEKLEAEKKAAQEKLAQEKLAQEKLAKEKAEAAKKLALKKAAEKAAAEKAAAQKAAAEKAAAEKRAAEQKAQQQNQVAPVAAPQSGAQPAGSSADQADATGEADGRRYYSIQAGMFASKTNALSYIEKLAAKNFKAYVTDFVSSSGAVKYNVRVGRFETRDEARNMLREYQKSFTTPAYVVITQ